MGNAMNTSHTPKNFKAVPAAVAAEAILHSQATKEHESVEDAACASYQSVIEPHPIDQIM
jgi:hypothetical protein